MAQQSNYWGKHDSKDHVVFGTSLVVQWLRLHTLSAGGQGLIPGQGPRSHVPQVRPGTAKEISKFCLFFWKKDHVFFRLEQGSRDSFVSYKHGSPMDFLLKEAAFQQEKKSNSYPETFFFFPSEKSWEITLQYQDVWRRKWQSTPGFLPGEFHEQRSLAAIVHGVTELDTTEHSGCCGFPRVSE